MRRTLSMLTLAVLTVGLLGSCSKINERLDGLDKRIDGLENERIASIDKQIENIESSISDLSTIRQNIKDLTATATSQGKDITDLRAADAALGTRVDDLQKFIEYMLGFYPNIDWVKATFSTIEQYEATCDTIAKIDAKLGQTSEQLAKDIEVCADSLTRWVNTKFEGYYTAAQIDAKLAEMKARMDTASGISKEKTDSIAAELTKVKDQVDTAKANIRAEYKAAIKNAIEESEGKLTAFLQDAIDNVNSTITDLTKRVGSLETKVWDLIGKVNDLEDMVQAVTIIPAYDDGSVELVGDTLFIDCAIDPISIVRDLKTNDFSILLKQVKMTKAGSSIDTLPVDSIKSFKKDLNNGTVSIKANIAKYVKSVHYYTVAVNVKIKHSKTFTSSATTNYANIPFPSESVFWENTENTPIRTGEGDAWLSEFLFGPEGADGCIANFDADTWAVIKDGVFRAEVHIAETGEQNIRICSGWWTIPYGGYDNGDIRMEGMDHNCIDLFNPTDWETGIGYLELNMKEDSEIHSYDGVGFGDGDVRDNVTLYSLLDEQGLLFTGKDYTLRKLYCTRR